MAEEGDVLSEQIVIDDSQAMASLTDLVTGVTALNDKFIMLLGTLGNTAGGLKEVASAEVEGADEADVFAGAMEKAGMALQMAFGFGVYQIVNSVINIIKGGVQDGLDFAQSMFLINSAVDEMRGAGIDVQFKNLSDIVTTLGPKLQAFSNLDLSKAVGQVAALGGQFGMTADQVSTLTEFAAVASERMGGDIATNAQTITAAIENLTTQMSRRLLVLTGAEITAQEVYNEAVKEGIDNGAKTYQNLSEEAKMQAGIALIEQQRGEWQKWEAEYQKASIGKVKDLGAAWQNLWTGFGMAITNVMPALTSILDFIIGAIAVASGGLKTLFDMISQGSWKNFAADLEKNINTVYDLYTNPTSSQVTGAPTTPSTTPLGQLPPTGVLSPEDQAKIEAEAEKKIIDLHDQEAAELEKIQTDLGNKLEDITTKYNRDLENIEIDAANKREQIYAQTAETLQTDAEHKRLADIEAQQKYQDEMENLLYSFQANLEDALRSRDAKAIIHLIEEYDNQKAEKARQFKEDQKFRDENYQQEINDAKRQEQFQLQELAVQVAERKAALALQYKQEQDDAKLAAQRQADAEKVNIDNNLKQWEDGLLAQYKITDDQMKNIYNDINLYLGKGGFVDQVYTYIINRMMQVYAALGSGMTTGVHQEPHGGMAAGGSIFASKPTDITFGEAGPELAMFIPLGSNFGTPSASFGGGVGGSIQLQVTLDKNLQAQIIQTSLNNVALVIDRVQRQV